MNLVVVGQTVQAYVQIRRKNWAIASRLSRSLKVIGTATYRAGIYNYYDQCFLR